MVRSRHEGESSCALCECDDKLSPVRQDMRHCRVLGERPDQGAWGAERLNVVVAGSGGAPRALQ